jgi:acetyl esterase/lipase
MAGMPHRCPAILAVGLGLIAFGTAETQAQPAPPKVVPPPSAQTSDRIDRDVVYGMVSGLALLMDVYRPVQPNGVAIVAIQGSGWYQPMRYDAPALKERPEVVGHAQRFAAAGYTVFSINHRSAPRFRYPDPIDDAQRAVRFVRAHAAKYGVSAERIGAWGSSSGGHLVELLGTLDGTGDAADADPVNRLSAKVQAVVALFAPSDLATMFPATTRQGTVSALMGFAYQDPALPGGGRPDDVENRRYREASPVTHVTADDAPMLLFHGDEDDIVPVQQSELMEATLRKAGVDVRFVKVPGGKHGPEFRFRAGDPRKPDELTAAVAWFDAHLKAAPGPPRSGIGASAPRTIAIAAADGTTIQADVYGSGERTVVLAHGGRFTRSSWKPQAAALVDAGFRAVAIDFRASCQYDAACLAQDVLAAVRYLRESAAKTVAVVGASLGGGAAAQAAIDAPDTINRIVLIAPMTVAAPEQIRVPALFILARDDASGSGPRLPGIREQYQKAQGPKELVLLDGSAHAQFLFDTPQGERLLREILRFVSQY